MVHCVSIPDAVGHLASGEESPEWLHFDTIEGPFLIRAIEVSSIRVKRVPGVDLTLETDEVDYEPESVDWSGHTG